MKTRLYLLTLFITVCTIGLRAQDTTEVRQLPTQQVDYSEPKEYEIGEVKVTGANFSDDNAIRIVSGLKKGNKIKVPGDDIKRAMQNLWRQKLFTDIQIVQEKVIGDVVFLEIILQERPRLSRYTYTGIKKLYEEDLNTLLKPFLLRGGIVTDATKVNAITAIKNFFIKKGFLDVEVEAIEKPEEKVRNAILLEFAVDRNERVKVQDIVFDGNETVTDKKLRKQMKNTKVKRRFLASSKYIEDDYEADKRSVIDFYNTIGYRDARITDDTLWRDEEGRLFLGLSVDEGDQYY
ncbi:MAG: outer membrane protein assembly factor BamA, partial [Saprospiraceae bacterium]|nr:outer membrane protein assembly factor BamA [Saprospiraceae bacterium]